MTRSHSTAVGKEGHDRLGGGEMPCDEEELLVTVVGKEETVDVCEGPGFPAKILRMRLEKMLCMRGRGKEAVKR